MRTFIINENDSGQRIDKYLSKSFPNLPKSLIYKGIRTKKIKLNRKRTEQNKILSIGDSVEIFLPDIYLEKDNSDEMYMFIKPRLNIIHEDNDIILVDKAPGMAVHSGDNSGSAGGKVIAESDTLINHIKAYLYQKGEYIPDRENSFSPALCNRIDRNTGGIVIAAKNAAALRRINEEIRNGNVTKKYLCAVHGILENKSGRLTGWIEKDSVNNLVTVYKGQRRTETGRTVITDYRVISEKNNLSLLEVTLVTGRTHQIRAHFASIGHPLLGDGKYGINRDDKKIGYKYQALYSYRLELEGKTYTVPVANIKFLKEFDECFL